MLMILWSNHICLGLLGVVKNNYHRLHVKCMDEYEPCERCGESRILDGAHRICFDCFIELDLEFHEKELLKELEEE